MEFTVGSESNSIHVELLPISPPNLATADEGTKRFRYDLNADRLDSSETKTIPVRDFLTWANKETGSKGQLPTSLMSFDVVLKHVDQIIPSSNSDISSVDISVLLVNEINTSTRFNYQWTMFTINKQNQTRSDIQLKHLKIDIQYETHDY